MLRMNRNEILEFIKKETGLSTINQLSVQITVDGWINLMDKYHNNQLKENEEKVYKNQINI